MASTFDRVFGPQIARYVRSRGTTKVTLSGGENALGPVPGRTTAVRALVVAKRRWVRNAQGVEVVSEATLYCSLRYRNDVAPGALVALPGSTRKSEVIAVIPHDYGQSSAVPEHLEVVCS